MIVSHEHKFVFIKTKKTASTSVEIALSSVCGPDDVITPITPRDELVRVAQGQSCQNFLDDRAGERAYLERLRDNGPDTPIPKAFRPPACRFYNHMPLREVYEHIPEARAYFKIITERHPYEKAVSFANFSFGFSNYKKTGSLAASTAEIRDELDQLIDINKLERVLSNWDWYSIDGQIDVDCVIQHATLQPDLADLFTRLGIPTAPPLAQTKVGGRDSALSTKDVLSDRHRYLIRQYCAREFEHFGYAI
jgi:hypothetical protein